jgi:hypothetical protein
MTLAIRERTIRDVAILNLTGSLTVGPGLALLEATQTEYFTNSNRLA